mmetsp:Transcript_4654/g.6354  ORF Transcript_4654/g.6354 Transcript_4654/m.6354 type:complete len:246 (+) Transcript_4654:611-1348(+)
MRRTTMTREMTVEEVAVMTTEIEISDDLGETHPPHNVRMMLQRGCLASPPETLTRPLTPSPRREMTSERRPIHIRRDLLPRQRIVVDFVVEWTILRRISEVTETETATKATATGAMPTTGTRRRRTLAMAVPAEAAVVDIPTAVIVETTIVTATMTETSLLPLWTATRQRPPSRRTTTPSTTEEVDPTTAPSQTDPLEAVGDHRPSAARDLMTSIPLPTSDLSFERDRILAAEPMDPLQPFHPPQ